MISQTVTSIFIGIIIAIVSSWFTVRLSLKKFQKEKLWQAKHEAYIKLVESLHNVKKHMTNEEDFMLGVKNRNHVSDEDFALYRTSHDEILKYRDIGALILSNKAVILLDNYLKQTNVNMTDYIEEIWAIYNAAESCLEKIILIAQEDLKT